MSYASGKWTPCTINIECPHCDALLTNPYNGTALLDGAALFAITDEPLSVIVCEKCGERYRLPEITRWMMQLGGRL